MAYLLDTNIVIHLRERNALVIGKFQQLTEPPLISVATQVELEGGVYVDPDISDRRREAVDALLRICRLARHKRRRKQNASGGEERKGRSQSNHGAQIPWLR